MYEQAERLCLKSLNIKEKLFNTNKLSMVTSYDSLALIYKLMKKYKKVEYYYLKALDILEETLDENHLSIASSNNKLAIYYYEVKDFKNAYIYEKIYIYKRKIYI